MTCEDGEGTLPAFNPWRGQGTGNRVAKKMLSLTKQGKSSLVQSFLQNETPTLRPVIIQGFLRISYKQDAFKEFGVDGGRKDGMQDHRNSLLPAQTSQRANSGALSPEAEGGNDLTGSTKKRMGALRRNRLQRRGRCLREAIPERRA